MDTLLLEKAVLIETLWNVKFSLIRPLKVVERINRNIVECKVNFYIFRQHIILRINRNIVECKDHHVRHTEHQEHCINRNIVECKDTTLQTVKGYNKVLIETLWNVKNYLRFNISFSASLY